MCRYRQTGGEGTHHVYGLAHEALVIRPLLREHVVCVVICSRGLAGLRAVVLETGVGVGDQVGRCGGGRAKHCAHVSFLLGQLLSRQVRQVQSHVKPKTTMAKRRRRRAQCSVCPGWFLPKSALVPLTHSLARCRAVTWSFWKPTPPTTPSHHRTAGPPGTHFHTASTLLRPVALRVSPLTLDHLFQRAFQLAWTVIVGLVRG